MAGAEDLLRQLVDLMRAPGSGRTGGGERRVLDTRGVRLPEFDGEIVKFGEWTFAFKRCIRSMSPRAYEVMVAAEANTLDESESNLAEDAAKISGEVYDLLCQACTGEAIAILRGVEDCRGLYAWKKLHEKYRPKTLARHVQLLQAVLNPPKITDGREMETRYGLWKEKVREEQSTFGSLSLSERAKIAILTAMMPPWVQEYIYMHAQDSWDSEVVWEKIRAMSANKSDVSGPAPMDIGDVRAGEEEQEVAAVSKNTRCYRCGGYGHISSQCRKPKGGGKGGPEAGAGPTPKGKGKGGKGGYQGTCWTCQKVGHKSWECPT